MTFTLIKPSKLIILSICLLFALISRDQQYDFDENDFVYMISFASIGRLSEWTVQTPGERSFGWYEGKIGHLYILHTLTNVFGRGLFARACIDGFFIFLVLGVWTFSYFIFKRVSGNTPSPYEMSLFVLCHPLSFWLAGKAVGETSALFFGTCSVLLFLVATESERLSRWGWYFLSALLFTAATICRLESFILFYGFGLGLLASGYKNSMKLLSSYFQVSIVIIATVLLFIIVTGINPYTFMIYGGQSTWDASTTFANKIYLVIASQGFFGILVLLSLWRLSKNRLCRFGVVFLLSAIVPFFIYTQYIVARYFYMTIIPAAVLAYIGFGQVDRYLGRFTTTRVKSWIMTILFLALVLGNILLAQPLYGTGITGKPLHRLMSEITEQHDNTIILVDSPTNVFSYLRYTYPELTIGLTRVASPFHPNQVTNLQSLRPWLMEHNIIYLNAYGAQTTWVERAIRAIKGESLTRDKNPWNNWIVGSEQLDAAEIARQGQYTAYLITGIH